MTRVRKTTSARIAATIAVIAALMHAHVPAAGAATGDSVTPKAIAGVHQPAIDALEAVEEVNVLAGIGCAPDAQGAHGDGLCPNEPLARWQAAVLLVRMVDRTDPQDTVPGWSRYSDVGDEWWAAHVERAADLGITSECDSKPLTFCPHSEVSRAQMSALLAKAFDLPPAPAAGFIDVPADHAFAQDIDRLAAARITAGCQRDPARYCPERALTRAQAASFAARAAGLVEPAMPVEPYPYRPAADPTPLPVDPAVRVGSLANGLTYYLRSNDSPGSNLELILTVRAGSVNEPAPGLGLAHFLEHMLFRGTEDYPGRMLHDALRDLGLEVGPDVNATVGYDHTSFTFSLVGDDPEGVRKAFELLAQMAFAATLSADAVEAERGVVLDELRLSTESAAGAVGAEFDRIYTHGTRYAGRRPIGTSAGIRSITPDDLRRFYSRWFVPSNMAVVAVGDWPLDDLQAHLEEYFGSAESDDEAPATPRNVVVPDGTLASHVVTDPENAFSYISLDIPIPVHDTSTVGGQRAWLAETLITVMLNTRLSEAFERGELSQVDTPSIELFSHNDDLRYLGTNWRGENLAAASTDYLTVLLTAKEHGFTGEDTARAAERVRAALRFQLDSTGTIQDSQYAQRYLAHFRAGTDISSAESRNQRLMGLLDDLSAAELTAHYRWLMDRSAPIAIAVGPDAAGVPTPQQLTAALAAATAGPPPEQTEAVEELVATPAPADVVSTRTLTSLDGVEWTFANGARVLFVKSGIARSSVDLRAVSLGGWSLLEPGDRALAPSAVSAVLESGFGDLSRQQVRRYLETRTASLGAFISETTEGFTGSAGTADAETLFQLLHLAVTAPRIDREAYDEAVNVAGIRVAQSEVNPAWRAWVAYNEARFDPAWHRPVPTRDQLASLSAGHLLELYRERLGKVDDLVVAVAGDIDAAEVERLARHYIGTLPAGAADTYADRRPPMPQGAVRRNVAVGEGESAVVEIFHEWAGPLTPQLRAAAALLEAVLEQRLYAEIREELGDTYVTSVSVTPRFTPQPAIDSTVTVTAEAARVEEILSRVLSILAEAAAGVGEESLAEAMASVESDNRLISNQTILEALTETHFMDEKDLFTPLRRLAQAAAVTASDVRSLATKLYRQGGSIQIVRTPTP